MVGVSKIKPAGGEMGKPLDFTAHGPFGETSRVPVSSPGPFGETSRVPVSSPRPRFLAQSISLPFILITMKVAKVSGAHQNVICHSIHWRLNRVIVHALHLAQT